MVRRSTQGSKRQGGKVREIKAGGGIPQEVSTVANANKTKKKKTGNPPLDSATKRSLLTLTEINFGEGPDFSGCQSKSQKGKTKK